MIEVLKQMQEALREYHYYTIGTGSPNQSMLNKGYTAYQAGLQAIAELESQYPHGMYGAEDLNKAWKSGYDNCKDQYAYLDKQEPVGRFAKFTDGIWREVTDYSAGVPLYTHPPQRKCENCGEFGICCLKTESQEQNFCSRCGKRTNDIHTCTPPQDNT